MNIYFVSHLLVSPGAVIIGNKTTTCLVDASSCTWINLGTSRAIQSNPLLFYIAVVLLPYWHSLSSQLNVSAIIHSCATITICFYNLLCSGMTSSLPEANHFISIFIDSNKSRTHSHRSSNFLDVSIEWNTGRPLSVLLKTISVTLPSSHLAQCGTVLAGSDFIFVSKNMAKSRNDWEKLSIKVGLLKGGGEAELLECKLAWHYLEQGMWEILREIIYDILSVSSRWNSKLSLSICNRSASFSTLYLMHVP